MTQLSPTEIDLLRTRPHNTKLWLSIYNPNTVLSCQITGSVSKGERVIPYYNWSGDYLNVNEGMTMYIGSSAEEADKGKIRVRSITQSVTGSFITVAENSNILWGNDDYLTIVDFYEINAVYPRIIQDPGDETVTLWYKDYDIEYANQNSILGAFVCMGSHYAGFTEDNVYYSATGTTHVVSGTSLSYHWIFGGGNPTGSSLLTPGDITYSTPGYYTTELIVSGSNGSVDTSYRHISIYNRPEAGTNIPILKWELLELHGDKEGGGYNATIRIYETVLETDIRNGALVVIFADDWYNNQKISIGGNQQNRESIVFSGYIVNGSIKYNYRSSFIEFEVLSPTGVMQNTEGFSVSITDSYDPAADAAANPNYYPSAWALVQDLSVENAIYHYLRWHSTTLKCCDFQFLASDRRITGHDFDRSSVYDAINTLISSALLGRVVSDRQGKIWMEREIYVDPTSHSVNTFLLSKQDWMDEPYIEERQTDETSYLEIGGVSYIITGGAATPLLAAAPGMAPGYRGSVQRVQGLALLNQTELNTLAGYLYNYWNIKYPELSFKLTGNYRNFDVAPQEKYTITINADDTPRGTIISVPTFLKNISFQYDPSKEALLASPVFSQLPSLIVADGITITIPATPPEPDAPDIPEVPPISYPTGSAVTGGITSNFIQCQGLYDVPITTYLPVASNIDGTHYTIATAIHQFSSAGVHTLTPVIASIGLADGANIGQTFVWGYKSTDIDLNTANYIGYLQNGYTTFAQSSYSSFDVLENYWLVLKSHQVSITVDVGDIFNVRFSINVTSQSLTGFQFLGWIIDHNR